MKEAVELDHLKALPLLVIVRTKGGDIRSRDENARWTSLGKTGEASWEEADVPAKVIWDYASEIGDPGTEALANLALAMLQQQMQQQQQAMQQQMPSEADRARIAEQFAQQPPQPPQPNGAGPANGTLLVEDQAQPAPAAPPQPPPAVAESEG